MFKAAFHPISMLDKHWQARRARIHRQKMRNARPAVNTKSPPIYRHLQTQRKKHQLQEEKYTEIQRENRILLERMNRIMKSKRVYSSSPEKRITRPKISRINRLDEQRLEIEKKALFERLLKKNWRPERQYQRTAYVKYRHSADSRMNSEFGQFPRETTAVSSNRKKLVARQEIYLEQQHFIVEISRTKEKIYVYAYEPLTSDSYALELNNREAKELMGDIGDYQRLIRMLALEDGELVLVEGDPLYQV